MRISSSKLPLFLLFPVFALVVIAHVVAFYSPAPTSIDSFQLPDSADVIGFYSEKPLIGSAQYSVEWQESGRAYLPLARLQISVTGPVDTTIKILLPLDAEVQSKEIREEQTVNGMHAFVAPVLLGPHETKIFNFRYTLPFAHAAPESSGSYSLYLIPRGASITYSISLTLPAHMSLNGSGWKFDSGRAGFSSALKTPKRLHLAWAPDTVPLTLVKAEMLSLDKIVLTFNKPLSRDTADDLINFSLKDANVRNAEITDRIFVERALPLRETLTLRVSGITLQRGELYELTLTGLRDIAGNFLESAPLKIPLTQ